MAFSISQNIIEFLNKNSEKLTNLSNADIARFMIKHDELFASQYSSREDSLRVAVSIAKKKANQLETEITVKDDAPKEIKTAFKVIGERYFFYPIKGEFSLPIKLVDELFYDFSKHGLDLSSTEVINKHNLLPHEWHSIKSALRLYKLSNIFSPHTTENLSPEELQEAIRVKMDERINTVGFKVESEYNKSVIKKYNEVIKKDAKDNLVVQTIITELFDILPQAEVKPIRLIRETDNEDEISLVIADLHIGMKNYSEKLEPFSLEVVKTIFQKIAKQINKLGAKKVHVFCLGDLIESFSGENHLGSWKGLEQGMYGANLVLASYKMIVEFLSQIENLASFNLVPGNHDRSSASNKEDTEGFIAKIIFEFIKLSYQDSGIELNYDDLLISKKVKNINFITTHGHHGISKMPPSELILEYGDPYCFNVLLQGHFHKREIKKDAKQFRDLIVPPLMVGNLYSLSGGWSTSPGFLIIKECETERKPIILDYPL